MIWQTNREVVAEVDRLLDDHTDGRIAAMLNERGWHPGKGGMFTKGIIAWIQNHYRLRSRFDRLREAGMLTQEEIANQLGVTQSTIQRLEANRAAQGPCLQRQAGVSVRARRYKPATQAARYQANGSTSIPDSFR